MVFFALILFVAVALSNSAPQFGNTFSSFTDALSGEVNGDYETAPYTIVQNFEGYQEREYPSVKWVCTEETYTPVDEESFNSIPMIQEIMSMKNSKNEPSSEMFMKLFRYISGTNEESREIPMTTPVLSEMTTQKDGQMTNEMCFYIDPKNQNYPPTPEDPTVRIVEKKKMRVFVHQFGGYAMGDGVWKREAETFATKLADNNEVDFSSYYTASYDSPMKVWNRRNEVMYVKKVIETGENKVL